MSLWPLIISTAAPLVVAAIISAFLSSFVASEKGRNGVDWFIIGLVCGILGLIAIAGLPPRQQTDQT